MFRPKSNYQVEHKNNTNTHTHIYTAYMESRYRKLTICTVMLAYINLGRIALGNRICIRTSTAFKRMDQEYIKLNINK